MATASEAQTEKRELSALSRFGRRAIDGSSKRRFRPHLRFDVGRLRRP